MTKMVAMNNTNIASVTVKEEAMSKFELNGKMYVQNDAGTYFYVIENGKKKRISEEAFTDAFDQYWDMEGLKEKETRQKKSEEDAEIAEKAVTKKRIRKPKNVAFKVWTDGIQITSSEDEAKEGFVVLTLTDKQVDFLLHVKDTCFWDNGLDSTPWIDVLCDEIGGQFAGKPMTVGAMISTLREKNILDVGVDRVNGKKAKYFVFTELGKQIAQHFGIK